MITSSSCPPRNHFSATSSTRSLPCHLPTRSLSHHLQHSTFHQADNEHLWSKLRQYIVSRMGQFKRWTQTAILAKINDREGRRGVGGLRYEKGWAWILLWPRKGRISSCYERGCFLFFISNYEYQWEYIYIQGVMNILLFMLYFDSIFRVVTKIIESSPPLPFYSILKAIIRLKSRASSPPVSFETKKDVFGFETFLIILSSNRVIFIQMLICQQSRECFS